MTKEVRPGAAARLRGMTALVDAQLALDWTRGVAARWLPPHRVYERDDLPPKAIREITEATIEAAAAAMAATPGAAEAGCSTDADDVARWLAGTLEAAAAADADTRTEDRLRLRSFGTRPRTAGSRALRRWNALLRVETTSAGIDWLRGRGDGDAAFEVVRVDGRWTVVEHGWAADEETLRERMIPAAATAASRHGDEAAGSARLAEEIAAGLEREAEAYCAARDEGAGGAVR